MTGYPHRDRAQDARWLFWAAAVVFGVALVVHAADHFRRGIDVLPPAVLIAGWLQIALALVTLLLVYTGSRWAPHAAIVIGFASALGFAAAHLLPYWGFFSDSFIHAPAGSGVSAFSWGAAIFEIIADIIFGIAGIAMPQASK